MSSLAKKQTRREALAGITKLAGATLLGEGLLPKTVLSSPAGYSPMLSVEIYVWMQHFQEIGRASCRERVFGLV